MSQLKVNSIVPIGGVVSGQGGGIIQTIQETFEDSNTSSTSYTSITGFTASITPKSVNSKILITSNCGISTNNQSSVAFMNLLRGSTPIAQPSGSESFSSTATIYEVGTTQLIPFSFIFLDDPNLTSITQLTYKWEFKTNLGTVFVNNRNGSDMKRLGTIILQEVSA
tara:strand:- start:17 stop:517 length:501 start_codon:yes stop_codon:yes gene_type:complete